jgi:FixJ family two-component response regulator
MIFNGSRICEAGSNFNARVSGANLRKKHRVPAGPLISIIDDDESMLSALVSLVRSGGYDARGFTSAEEFLGCGMDPSLACIITDVQMPGMSGIELKQHLEACQVSAPVIMITARHEPGLEERALAGGAVCFLRKPFEGNTLIGCIEKALKT